MDLLTLLMPYPNPRVAAGRAGAICHQALVLVGPLIIISAAARQVLANPEDDLVQVWLEGCRKSFSALTSEKQVGGWAGHSALFRVQDCLVGDCSACFTHHVEEGGATKVLVWCA